MVFVALLKTNSARQRSRIERKREMSLASPMNTPEIIQAITPLIDAFKRFSISYYIGGSVASSVHGKSRATQDVDIVAEYSASAYPTAREAA
jgi:hypothetical protein